MNEQTMVHQGQAAALAKVSLQPVVRLMLRCPQCKQRSLCIGKSTGEKHVCPSCQASFAVK